MNTISTTSSPAAAPPPMPVGAATPAAPAQALAAGATPLFFAQFLGLEAAAGADIPEEADSSTEAAIDPDPAIPADAPGAARTADLPGMAMLMMPPPALQTMPPPALQTPTDPGYGAAVPDANTAVAAPAAFQSARTAAQPVRTAPQPALPAAGPAAIAAPVAAAVSAPLTAAVADSAIAATPDAPAAAVSAAVPAAVSAAVSAPGFAAVFASAGAIALPPATMAPVRAEPPLSGPAATPGAAALPATAATAATAAEAPARSFAADAGAGAATWGVAAPAAPAAAPAVATGAVALEGAPQQWQQTLRDALGERLQTQVGRNSEHAVIRLDPPQLGRIEISIRHSAGALQVTLSATHGDVLRQLHTIGDSVRQQLSQQAFTDVALVVTSATAPARGGAAQSFADGGGRQRGSEQQHQSQRDDAQPGRALSEAGQAAATFAMQPEWNNS